ncbi:hypothetical protein [Thermococcus sp.]|uniref:hypothetical protein n=1 Tax=Thermococcus sp. TaxID=35749 RepID=UPI00260999C1|nr:hypothetical protein [Thermococcus sp.]
MKRQIVLFSVFVILVILGYALHGDQGTPLNSAVPNENSTQTLVVEKTPSVREILISLGSHESFCWIVNGTSLQVHFFGIQAKWVKGCVNYANGSAVYWVKKTDGRSFHYIVNATLDELDWSVITHTYSPELNIINFLSWVLTNGNVTEVRKLGDSYEFHISLRYVEESNAGTIENPYLIRILQTWNVTLLVNGDGEPLNGHFMGRSRGPSNVYGANWFHEGNFTFLGEWKQ